MPRGYPVIRLWPWKNLSLSHPSQSFHHRLLPLLAFTPVSPMATAAPKLTTAGLFSAAPSSLRRRCRAALNLHRFPAAAATCSARTSASPRRVAAITCKTAEVSPSSVPDGRNWVPVVPLAALPKGERRVIIQDGETILLLWYKNDVFAIENRSPAEGAYSEGLLNAKLTQDGCIVCPTTDSTFDLQTGEIKEWYPKNPVLRALTPPLRSMFVYPAKTDGENIYISTSRGVQSSAATEIVFSGKAQPGVTATNVNVDEVRMVVDEELEGFGFTRKNELINGKAAVIGFLLLLDFELLTGKGLLKGTGFLDFIYSVSNALQ